jgi:membrane-associated phospholipid phosphatase
MPSQSMPPQHRPTLGDRLRGAWADRIDPDSYLGLHLTVSLAVIAASVWIFSALLDAVLDNATLVRWDMAVDLAIHQHMTPPSLRVVDWVTQLGSPIAMVILGIVVAIALWRAHRSAFWGWVAAFVGGAAIGQLLKTVVHRTRPAYGAAYLHGQSFSFPSGHAMGSIIGYGMLIYLMAHVWHVRQVRRRLALALVILLVLAIGASRILLGVHYPSDVVGGWAAGLGWMAVCIAGIRIARHRHADRAHPASAVVAPYPGTR